MNRYFLYLVILNMMINVIMFVPRILIADRNNGAVSAILAAIPISMMLSILYGKAFAKFPGQGMPDILANSKYKVFKILHLGGIQLFPFTGGLISLIGFVDILNRFIDPEMPKVLYMILFLAAIVMIITMPTQRVMYLLEIVLFINSPLIIFILFKSFMDDNISWDSILEVGTHLFKWPSIKSLAASTYVFSGFTNLIVFNRVIKEKLKIWNFFAIFILGVFNLFTTFFVPIGFQGADGSYEFLYPWISTADSMRLNYSPIERVLFIFLMFYMSISLLSVSIHWHVSLELIKGTFKAQKNIKKVWIVLSIYIVISIVCTLLVNTNQLNHITVNWLIIRMCIEISAVVIFFLWARRRTA